VTLQMPEDSVTFVDSSRPVADSHGRFFVAPLGEPGMIAVFGPNGRFLRTVGRFGSGPGEFRSITRLAAIPGDSILVFDNMMARMSVIAPTLEITRTAPAPSLVYGIARMGDGTLVAAALVGTRQGAGNPYHILGDRGIVRSFGATDETRPRDAAFAGARAITPAKGGGFWAGHFNRYEIERADSVGELHIVVNRTVDWFPAWTKSEGAPPWLVRPNPKLTALREDAHGNLWTFILVARKNWKPVMPQTNVRGDRAFSMPATNDIDRIIERVIEVIDPRTGNVRASRRVRGSFADFVGSDMIYRRHETEGGMIQITISRLELADTASH
jgi:hypothetical protein